MQTAITTTKKKKIKLKSQNVIKYNKAREWREKNKVKIKIVIICKHYFKHIQPYHNPTENKLK